jgi:hypothetical protein
MSELKEILAKRRRKSEVHGAIVENAPKETIADHAHSKNSLDEVSVDNNKDRGDQNSDVKEDVNDGAGSELKRILQRRRRKSETASSVIIKHGKLSDADAKHSHHEYESVGGVEVNISVVESRLSFLETKAEKDRKDMVQLERIISKNERLLSEMSLTNDVDDADSKAASSTGNNEHTISLATKLSSPAVEEKVTSSESNIKKLIPKTIINDDKKQSSEDKETKKSDTDNAEEVAVAKEEAEEGKEKEPTKAPLKKIDDSKESVLADEKANDDKILPGSLTIENNDDGNDNGEGGDKCDNDDTNSNSEDDDEPAEEEGEDPNLGKVEIKPGFWVTPDELSQLRIFLPSFKSVPNERLYKVLPQLMKKTAARQSNLDNRPRWK